MEIAVITIIAIITVGTIIGIALDKWFTYFG